MYTYGYTEDTERFPIDYECLPFLLFFSFLQKRDLSVDGEIYHLVFNSNIREHKSFGLRMKMTERPPDVEA